MVVAEEKADEILQVMKEHELGKNSAIVGEVVQGNEARVTVLTALGAETIIDMLPGEQLPRIC